MRPKILAGQERIRAHTTTETLSQLPKIATWKRAYSAFGAKPKKYRSSVESLCRMASLHFLAIRLQPAEGNVLFPVPRRVRLDVENGGSFDHVNARDLENVPISPQ